MTPEARLLHAIRLALGDDPRVVLWRTTPVAPDPSQPRRGLPPGWPDLCGVVAPSGRWLAIEAKSASGRVAPEQAAWGALLTRMGGVYAICRSVDDALAALDRACQVARSVGGAQGSSPSPVSSTANTPASTVASTSLASAARSPSVSKG